MYARVWETLPHKDDNEFWCRPEQILAHDRLINGGHRVLDLTSRFMSSPAGPNPSTDSTRYMSVLLDKMHGLGVFLIAKCMPRRYTRRQLRQLDPKWREVLGLIEQLFELSSGKNAALSSQIPSPGVTTDNGLLIAIHVTLYGTGDRDIRRRAMDLLRLMQNKQEGLYDAKALLEIFEALGADGHGSYADELLQDDQAGPGLGGLDGILGIDARLKAMSL